jgi:hypothetical protein
MNPAHHRPDMPISLLAFAGGPPMSTKRSRVHPPYKTKCRVTNWASYNKMLVNRGNLRLWISLDAISRQSKNLKIKLRAKVHLGPIHLIIDSTGLSVFGQGQWAAAKHGKQGWKKLYLGVDDNGILVAETLTGPNVDDAKTGVTLIKKAGFKVKAVVGDAACDSREIYQAAEDHGARIVVPPLKTARVSGHSPQARNRAVKRIAKVGLRRWKIEVRYHRQGKVENAFFRYKTMIGDRLRSRGPDTQKTEVILGCNILNRLYEQGRPLSVAIRD